MNEWREQNINFVKRLLTGYNFVSIYIILLLFFNIGLTYLPLTSYLGYEFSVLNSIFIVILSAVYAIQFFKKGFAANSYIQTLKTLSIISVLFITFPLIVILIKSAFAKPCPIADGILFYIFITVPAPIIGMGLGFLCILISRRFAIFLFPLVFLIVALIPVFEIYFNPQIYFYNPLVGFFPGTIYDEGISVDVSLISYRLCNLLFFASIIFMIGRALISPTIKIKILIWSYCIVIPIVFILISPFIGYATTDYRIQRELNRTITSEHFIIYCSSNVSDTLIQVVALHHEFYFKELSDFFNLSPKKKIRSIIFDSNSQKKRLFGTENADVAKPWIPEIYSTIDNYDRTLRHEIAHCFAGEFGSSVFKVADSFNPALIEGIAMAASPSFDEFDLHYLAALAFANGYELNITVLFNSFNFFIHPSSLGYIIAGSFVKFIVDTYGIEKFKKLYDDFEFEKHYGKNLADVSEEYQQFLNGEFSLSFEQKDRANYYFGRKSILYKVCPRFVARRLKDAWQEFSSKKYEKAKQIFAELVELSENYSAIIGLAYCLEKQNQHQQAVALLEKFMPHFKNSAYFYEIEFSLAEILAKNRNYSLADSIFKVLINQNPNRSLYGLALLRNDLIKFGLPVDEYISGDKHERYNLLIQLNAKDYNYNSFAFLAGLARINNIRYDELIKLFSKPFEVKDYHSSYGLYSLSSYMCEKMDFELARKTAALSLRYSNDKSIYSILKNNFDKQDWLYKNKNLLNKFSYSEN